MNAKSVKRAFGLAAAAVSTGGAMMLAPAVANAATAHPAHAQTVGNVSKTSGGWGWGWGHHRDCCFHRSESFSFSRHDGFDKRGGWGGW